MKGYRKSENQEPSDDHFAPPTGAHKDQEQVPEAYCAPGLCGCYRNRRSKASHRFRPVWLRPTGEGMRWVASTLLLAEHAGIVSPWYRHLPILAHNRKRAYDSPL